MLGVTIHINDQAIVQRSVVRRPAVNDDGEHKYVTDTGEVIWHDRDDGAVVLAEKLLAVTDEPDD